MALHCLTPWAFPTAQIPLLPKILYPFIWRSGHSLNGRFLRATPLSRLNVKRKSHLESSATSLAIIQAASESRRQNPSPKIVVTLSALVMVSLTWSLRALWSIQRAK